MISFLFIDTECFWRGGQEQLFTLVAGLHQRGHHVHMACPPQSPLASRCRETGIAVHSLRIRNEAGLFSLFQLIFLLRKIRPEIAAYNTPRSILIGNLASLFSSVRARIIFRRVNFPLRKNFITRIKYKWKVDCIIANSEAIQRQLQAEGISPEKIRTIYEGVDLSLFPKHTVRETPSPGKPIVVGTVAHMSSEKGLNYLVEAASLIPEVKKKLRFVLVGDGVCLPDLKESVQKLGLQEIFHFPGFQTNTRDFFRSFNLFVLPSLSEGFPSAILEAMATSLPVVASRTGGIPELVQDGHNGLLVPPGDASALAHAIHFLTENPGEAGLMGDRGRTRIESQFTMESKILKTEQLCISLLQNSQIE
jgi:L-malate glycosyltransferase